MITKRPTKKIIGAKTRAALEKQIKAEARPYQVLMKFGKGVKR